MATPDPTPIPIPRTVSAPADANAPSLLTTLPPELRNRIYDILFRRDEPVIVRDVKAYRELRQHASYTDQLALGALGTACCNEFAGSASVLRTCRQVYHEAASVLYGSNNFRFPPTLIPETIQNLSKITVEIQDYIDDNRCGCFPRVNYVDLVPLLRIMWARSIVPGKIEFVSVTPCRKIGNAMVNFAPRSHTEAIKSRLGLAEILNNMLVSLGADDALGIKRYGRFSQILPAVMVAYSSTIQRTWVCFKQNADPRLCYNEVCEFSTLQNGKSARWTLAQPSHFGFWHIPGYMRNSIYLQACAADPELFIDLEHKKILGASLAVMQLCKATRNRYGGSAVRRPKLLNFIVTVKNGAITSKCYEAATQWSNSAILQTLPLGTAQIVIRHTKTDQKTPAQQVFIEIDNLARLMCKIDQDEKASFWCKTTSHDITEAGQGIEWSVATLRCARFVLLSKILEEAPQLATHAPPKILVGGEFNTLQAVFPACRGAPEQTFDRNFSVFSLKELRKLGDRKLQSLRQLVAEAVHDESHTHRELAHVLCTKRKWAQSSYGGPKTFSTLIGMWESLKYGR